MAIIKCKICGGELQIIDRVPYATCSYCGSVTTVPPVSNQVMTGLYLRAETFRQQNDFASAISIYEKILKEDATEAEAHWGLLLAQYGIEYVPDPATGERIPTCHRLQQESILADNSYLMALQYAADDYSRSLYRQRAEQIAAIQQTILEISAKEDPYDIFICYKETAPDNQRTQDSVTGQEIYERLTDKGYRVFFARISLEGKLGSAYEPVIFSALNSAKAMLVLASDGEYVRAVWVKNEWSRYLQLQRKNKNRQIIPCTIGLASAELPKELSRFPVQDLTRPGAVQDLTRGLSKIVDAAKGRSAENSNPAAIGREIKALDKKICALLKIGEFDTADDYADRILFKKPTHFIAHYYKFLCECKISDISQIETVDPEMFKSDNLKKYLKSAHDTRKMEIENCINQWLCNVRLYQYARKQEELKNYAQAAMTYQRIKQYRDAEVRANQLTAAAYGQAVREMKKHHYACAIPFLGNLGNYLDSPQLLEICIQKHAVQRRLRTAGAGIAVVAGLLLTVYCCLLLLFPEFLLLNTRIAAKCLHPSAQKMLQETLQKNADIPYSVFQRGYLYCRLFFGARHLDSLCRQADGGKLQAISDLIRFGENSIFVFPPEFLLKNYQAAAAQGDKTAILHLAKEYEKASSNLVPQQDFAKAGEYYAQLVKLGDQSALKFAIQYLRMKLDASNCILLAALYADPALPVYNESQAVSYRSMAIRKILQEIPKAFSKKVLSKEVSQYDEAVRKSLCFYPGPKPEYQQYVDAFAALWDPDSAKPFAELPPPPVQRRATPSEAAESLWDQYKGYDRSQQQKASADAREAARKHQHEPVPVNPYLAKAVYFYNRLGTQLELLKKCGKESKNPEAFLALGDISVAGELYLLNPKSNNGSARYSIEPNYRHAFVYWKQAGLLGKLRLANCSFDGVENVSVNRRQAIALINEALADKNTVRNPEMFYQLGLFYLQKEGVSYDPSVAFRYFTAAAAKGHADAEAYLGEFHLYGLHGKKDVERGFELLGNAAEKGSCHARIVLARCFLEGTCIRCDFLYALELLQEPVAQNNPEALLLLSQCYENGTGTTHNPIKADAMQKELMAQGYMPAIRYLADQGQGEAVKRMLLAGSSDPRYLQRIVELSFRNYDKCPQRPAQSAISKAIFRNLQKYYVRGGRAPDLVKCLIGCYAIGYGCKVDLSTAAALARQNQFDRWGEELQNMASDFSAISVALDQLGKGRLDWNSYRKLAVFAAAGYQPLFINPDQKLLLKVLEQAIRYYRVPLWQMAAAQCYACGIGTERDLPRALRLMKQVKNPQLKANCCAKLELIVSREARIADKKESWADDRELAIIYSQDRYWDTDFIGQITKVRNGGYSRLYSPRNEVRQVALLENAARSGDKIAACALIKVSQRHRNAGAIQGWTEVAIKNGYDKDQLKKDLGRWTPAMIAGPDFPLKSL